MADGEQALPACERAHARRSLIAARARVEGRNKFAARAFSKKFLAKTNPHIPHTPHSTSKTTRLHSPPQSPASAACARAWSSSSPTAPLRWSSRATRRACAWTPTRCWPGRTWCLSWSWWGWSGSSDDPIREGGGRERAGGRGGGSGLEEEAGRKEKDRGEGPCQPFFCNS